MPNLTLKTFDHLTLRARQTGHGPDLLFLHGCTCSSLDWSRLLKLLPKNYRITLLDFRAHGKSDDSYVTVTVPLMVRDVGRAVRDLKLKKPILIGHSLGGMVAIAAALRWPTRFAGIVPIEGHSHLPTTLPGCFDDRTPKPILKRLQKSMAAGTQRLGPQHWRSLYRFDVRSRVSRLKLPVLSIWGDRYGDVSPAAFKHFLKAAGYEKQPQITHHLVKGSHHFVHIEQPRIVAGLIKGFLEASLT